MVDGMSFADLLLILAQDISSLTSSAMLVWSPAAPFSPIPLPRLLFTLLSSGEIGGGHIGMAEVSGGNTSIGGGHGGGSVGGRISIAPCLHAPVAGNPLASPRWRDY